jgi:hypothetical protein
MYIYELYDSYKAHEIVQTVKKGRMKLLSYLIKANAIPTQKSNILQSKRQRQRQRWVDNVEVDLRILSIREWETRTPEKKV